jgi:threonine/homoserine/homoserine lactone efflux protein
MIPRASLTEFAVAALLLAVAPGPDNLFVATHAAVHGARSGLLVTLGLCTGLVVHTLAVACGLAALLRTTPTLLLAIRLVGAAYLLYLAGLAIRAAYAPSPLDANGPTQGTQRSAFALYRRGVWMNLSNPKVALFFAALLPQFVDPAGGSPWLQTLLLGAVFAAATLIVFGGIACAAGWAGSHWLRSPRAVRGGHCVAALVFAAIALHLLRGGLAADAPPPSAACAPPGAASTNDSAWSCRRSNAAIQVVSLPSMPKWAKA